MENPARVMRLGACAAVWIAVLVLTILLGLQMARDCTHHHAPPLSRLNLAAGKFRKGDARVLAERIYEYRSQYLFSAAATDAYLDLFKKPVLAEPVPVADLSDVALHTLISCPAQQFSTLMRYAPMFNNSRYLDCVNAYRNGTFAEIQAGRATRDIIVRDVLDIDDVHVDNLLDAVYTRLKSVNPSYDQSAARMIDTLLNDSGKLYAFLQLGYAGLQDVKK